VRNVGAESQFTPFGMWVRQYCKDSGRHTDGGLSVTNLDFVVEDYLKRRLMLIEEKQNGGGLGTAQAKTFQVLDSALGMACRELGYEYWGFFVLKMPGTMPGPGMTLNGAPVTGEQLRDHINFEKRHCPPVMFPQSRKATAAKY
jgi:hypothetical protein